MLWDQESAVPVVKPTPGSGNLPDPATGCLAQGKCQAGEGAPTAPSRAGLLSTGLLGAGICRQGHGHGSQSPAQEPKPSPTELHLPASSLDRHGQCARVGIYWQEGRNLSFHLGNHSMSNMSDPQLGRSSHSCPAAACSQEIQNDWFDGDIWNQSQFKPQNQRNAGENIKPLHRKYPNRTQRFQAQLFLRGNQKFRLFFPGECFI